MNILFYRYNSICEPAILRAFRQLNIHVIEIDVEMTNKKLEPSKCVELLSHEMDTHHPLFVFSVNFFPTIAEVCSIYQTPYLCWTVDSPVPELFSKSITKATNRIFLFDKAQYEYFHPFHPTGTFHLPLASDVEHFDSVIASITEEDYTKYKNDICFIGSLYSEKNPFHQLSLPEYEAGYVRGITEAALNVYGYNFIEETITDDVICAIKKADTNFFSLPDTVTNLERYIASHQYIGVQVTEMERIRTLNELAKYFHVTLYTRSNPDKLKNVHVYKGIETLSEMPKAFHLSKINLNMTTRPIQTGLPLRIFDILGCGGFLMTNYQPELTEHFTIGEDLEVYTSIDELIEKCDYYLSHEDIRKQIAQNGYEKVRKYHTYQKRLLEMLRIVTTTSR